MVKTIEVTLHKFDPYVVRSSDGIIFTDPPNGPEFEYDRLAAFGRAQMWATIRPGVTFIAAPKRLFE